MRLISLTLKDFKGFAEATLDLDRPLTVLVGANGTGKTSVLEAITLVVSQLMHDFVWGDERTVELRRPNASDLRYGASSYDLDLTLSNGSQQLRQSVHMPAPAFRLQQQLDEHAFAFGLIRAAPTLLCHYPADRLVTTAASAFSSELEEVPSSLLAMQDALPARASFRPLFTWFKSREDVENEQKVAHGDLSREDPQLRAIRRAVAGMLPGYANLRVQRDPLHFTVRKDGGETLNLDQLSAGEKGLLALAADIARRLAIAYPNSADSLAEEGVIIIDEIELHLHPRWQRSVIGSLRRTFPGCQFIVTTHSPQVLSEVPTEAVVVIDQFAFVHPAAPTSGRDTNAILEEVMDTGARPAETQQALDAVATAIDHEDYPGARVALDRLTAKLTEDDAEIVRLRGMLEFLTAEVVGGSA